jgi:hypothetical protein
MAANVEAILKEHQAAKVRRSQWENLWELIARYVLSRKQGFKADLSPGDFLTHGDVFDDTAIRALNIMVSSLIGALWKNGARTFRLKKPHRISESKLVKDFYEEINRRTTYQMEHQKAGFDVAYQEYMLEAGAFGTAGIGIFPTKAGSENLVEYQAWTLKSMCVCEGSNGYVNKVFYEFDFTAFQLVEEYGDAAMTDEVKAALDTMNYEKKFRVLWIIRPRNAYNPSVQNNLNMPYESIHILVPSKTLLKESGFAEMPVKVTRFYKNRDEEYGRSPAMEALPSIVSLNDFMKLETIGAEKGVKPSLYLLDDGSFGGGVLDTSPDGLTVLDMSSRVTSASPIGVVAPVGDMSYMEKVMERLVNQIMSHFFVDRLLDLNNNTRMTLGEAQIRNEMRSESLGAIYNRQIKEGLTPIIERTISILFDAGELGVVEGSPQHKMMLAQGKDPLIIPPEVVESLMRGEDFYDIEYVSPAARVLRSEELRGIMSTWQFCATYGAIVPELMIGLDHEKSRRMVTELSGASDEINLSKEQFDEEVQNYREAQAAAAQQKLEASQADTAAKQGAANQQQAQAQATAAGAGVGMQLA